MNIEQRCTVKLKNVSSYLHPPINLVGIVVEFSIPDCCNILKIIDQSQQDPELCANLFTKDINSLPRIRGHKDIIILCNVRIGSYQGTASAAYYERTSSFALFEGDRDSDDFNTFQVSAKFDSL